MKPAEKWKIIMLMFLVSVLVCASVLWQGKVDAPSKVSAEIPKSVQEALEKQKVTVDVSGAVAMPGLYRLLPESRVEDAIKVAGGFLPVADNEKVNMARLCRDGMKINVPYKKEKKAPTASSRRGTTSTKAWENIIVNVNTAGEEQLVKLPGVGTSLAQSIIKYRTENGAFTVLEQLLDVKGMGEAKFEKLKDKIEI